MRGAAVTATVLLGALGIGACSSKSSDPPFKVTAKCRAAMEHDAAVGFDATDADDLATLTDCRSSREWLTAVRDYTGDDEHNVVVGDTQPLAVLQAYCQGHLDAPACDGVRDLEPPS